MTERQSGRLGVISNSTTWSSALMTGLMSSPGFTPSSWRTKMPSGMQWGNSACSARRSARVQMVPALVLKATRSPAWRLGQGVVTMAPLGPSFSA